MPLPTRQYEDDPFLRAFGGRGLPTTVDESIGATIADPRLRPTQLLSEFQQQEPERFRELTQPVTNVPVAGAFVRGIEAWGYAFPSREPQPDDDVELTPEQIKRDYGHLGVEFDTATPKRIVEMTARRRQEDAQREEIIAASPQNLGAMGTRFGAALIGSAVDPLNIASAFIPVLGEARFAAIASTAGRATARGASGAAAGIAGAAAIEPIAFATSRQLQLDYSMADALLNVALGGVLGGGLHIAGGALGDRLLRTNIKTDTGLGAIKAYEKLQQTDAFRASPAARESAFRASVAQTVQGREIDVSPVFEVDRTSRAAEAESTGIRPAETLADDPEVQEMVSYYKSVKSLEAERRKAPLPKPEGLAQFLASKGGLKDFSGEVAAVLGDPALRVEGMRGRPKLINEQKGRNLDDAALAAFEAGYFRERPSVAEFLDALNEDVRGSGYFTDEGRMLLRAIEEDQAGVRSLDELGLSTAMKEDEALEAAIEQVRAKREASIRPSAKIIGQIMRDRPETVKRLAEGAEPDDLRSLRQAADEAEALDEFEVQTAQELEASLDDALAEMAAEGYHPDEDEVLSILQGWVDEGEALGPAIRQGAGCMARTG
jgi:hypothetical protein